MNFTATSLVLLPLLSCIAYAEDDAEMISSWPAIELGRKAMPSASRASDAPLTVIELIASLRPIREEGIVILSGNLDAAMSSTSSRSNNGSGQSASFLSRIAKNIALRSTSSAAKASSKDGLWLSEIRADKQGNYLIHRDASRSALRFELSSEGQAWMQVVLVQESRQENAGSPRTFVAIISTMEGANRYAGFLFDESGCVIGVVRVYLAM